MSFEFPETFTLITRTKTGVDGDGNDVYGAVETAVKGAFAPQGSTELTQGQATVLDHDTIYLEAGTRSPRRLAGSAAPVVRPTTSTAPLGPISTPSRARPLARCSRCCG
jgi:hypothetical protein